MSIPQERVFTDDEITPQLLRILGGAQRQAVLVSPYLDLWGHLKNAIELAVKRGVTVTVLTRVDEEQIGGRDGGESVAWLIEHDVQVLALPRLHAKVYMNDTAVLLASMNLTEVSSSNSSEVAILLSDSPAATRVRTYVSDRLMKMAQPVRAGGVLDRFVEAVREVAKAVREAPAQYAPAAQGHCIRCGRNLVLDPAKPLCDSCYAIWAEYENEKYDEKYCHQCGRESQTSYARPLCRSCYAKDRR